MLLLNNKKMEGVDYKNFDNVVGKMRCFFRDVKGFREVHTQNKKSILAACEDPKTIATYNYEGQIWPLPQTGQMWLEHYLLEHPEENGFFCVSTSYRNEPDPVPGRHDRIFPMFEFELKGGMDELRKLEGELLDYLGFVRKEDGSFPSGDYDKVCTDYGVDVQTGKLHSNKIDVIMHGIETIGSAERSVDPEAMRDTFYTISGGDYANTLFAQFGKARVEKELEEFLLKPFFPRSGGGIGVTRMIRAMRLSGLLLDAEPEPETSP